MNEKFDIIVVGTGFASSFFLHHYLKKAQKNLRVLVLERGNLDSHAWQIEHLKNSSLRSGDFIINSGFDKRWHFTVGFGGGSNCWWAGTPRMLPSDFELQSRYGKGRNWPISYDELEPFYVEAEEIMQVSGPDFGSFLPKSKPYPQPPHRFNEPDWIMKKAYPNLYFQQPTARARIATSKRPQCCANGVCHLCPIDAKFSIQNEMVELYRDPRVTLVLEAPVRTIDTNGNQVTGVSCDYEGRLRKVSGELVVLGANALFNPYILLRSGFNHPVLGKFLNEQVSYDAMVDLNGVDSFQGSTSVTANAYNLYDGAHRKEKAACLIESNNTAKFMRMERGKWRQRMVLRCIMEDLPSRENYVKVGESDPRKAEIVYKGHSDYLQKTVSSIPRELEVILEPLPVEKIHPLRPNLTEGHIQGTTVMGNDPGESIVDKYLIHHVYRNLVVLGSGVFPTGPPVNPTLTLAALALWSANYLSA